MSNLLPYLVFLLGSLVFLFVYWKRLKEDYAGIEIFTSGFYTLVGTGIGSLVFGIILKNFLHNTLFFINTGLWFWGGVVGAAIGYMLGVLRFKLKIFETQEAVGISMLWLLLFFFVYDSFKNSSVFSLTGSVILLGLIGLFFFLEGKYRRFTWYKSGKVGFSGLATLGSFFLLRTVFGLIFPFTFSFIGRIDSLISGCISFILFLLLYNLGEQ